MTDFPVDVLSFEERASDPGATAGSGKYYTKDVSGVTRWFYRASDGTVIQLANGFTPPANSVQYQHLTNLTVRGPKTLAISTSLQSVFDASNDTINLSANTTYKIKGLYSMSSAANTGKINIGFSGGTIGVGSPGDAIIEMAAVTTINPTINTTLGSGRPILFISGNAANEWEIFDNIASSFKIVKFDGKIRTVSSGTFVPQIKLLNPTISPIIMNWSYLELIPVGGSTFESTGQGGWS